MIVVLNFDITFFCLTIFVLLIIFSYNIGLDRTVGKLYCCIPSFDHVSILLSPKTNLFRTAKEHEHHSEPKNMFLLVTSAVLSFPDHQTQIVHVHIWNQERESLSGLASKPIVVNEISFHRRGRG